MFLHEIQKQLRFMSHFFPAIFVSPDTALKERCLG